eukprot:1007182-Rhodomonas_salina.1
MRDKENRRQRPQLHWWAGDAHGKELRNDLLSTTTPGTTSLRSRSDTHQPQTLNAAPMRMNVHLHAISGMT